MLAMGEPKSRVAKLAAEYGITSADALAKLGAIGNLVRGIHPGPRVEVNGPAYRPVPPDPPEKTSPDWDEYKRALESGHIDVGPAMDNPPRKPQYGRCTRCGAPRDSQGCVRECDERRDRSVWATPQNVGRGKRSR